VCGWFSSLNFSKNEKQKEEIGLSRSSSSLHANVDGIVVIWLAFVNFGCYNKIDETQGHKVEFLT